MSPSWKDQVKKKIHEAATKCWNITILNSQHLAPLYPTRTTLQLQPYLTFEPFRGRLLLTKARVNDMPLRSTVPRCPTCQHQCAETTTHYLLHCSALTHIRHAHPFTTGLSLPQLLLTTPTQQTPARAQQHGNFLADLWLARCRIHLRPSIICGLMPPFY